MDEILKKAINELNNKEFRYRGKFGGGTKHGVNMSDIKKILKKALERQKFVSCTALMTLLVERGQKGDMERLIEEFKIKLGKLV